MRMAGNTRRCSTATVYSAPVIHCSANTTSSTAAAARYAASISPAAPTLLMPTLEPCVAGLTINGRPRRSTASGTVGDGTQHHGFRAHHAHGGRQALGPQLVHCQRGAHHAASGIGHSEHFQCALDSAVLAARSMQRDPHAHRIRVRASADSGSSRGSTPVASTPRRCRAASTARPEISEISRSAEPPPSSTATFPKSLASVMRFILESSCDEIHRSLSDNPVLPDSGAGPAGAPPAPAPLRSAASMSRAVAAPSLRMKLACFVDTTAPPMRRPLSPEASISRAA